MKMKFPVFEHIHPIIIPFDVAPELATANIYVLGKTRLTLIDTGPGIRGALEFVKNGFEDAGLSINNINRILITHGHMDHFGLTRKILKSIDHSVEVYMHPEDSWSVTTEFFEKRQWYTELKRMGSLAGIPSGIIDEIRSKLDEYYSIADPIDDVLNLEDSDEFEGEGYHLRVIHTPGHSPGMCCFYETRNKLLFSGDHILKDITPNPLITLDRNKLRNPEYQSLQAYKSSLEKVSGLDVSSVFTGHGNFIEDMKGVLQSYETHQTRRTNLVLEALGKSSATAFELVDKVFPLIKKEELFLALSEIMAHLGLLEIEGRVEKEEEGTPIVYRAVPV